MSISDDVNEGKRRKMIIELKSIILILPGAETELCREQ
jgi:hypothetical protein